jgi:tRNA pseudouridine13 synthase
MLTAGMLHTLAMGLRASSTATTFDLSLNTGMHRLLNIPLLLFTYQSYLWNEGARRLMQLVFPREHLFPMPYQAGTLLHHTDATPEVMQYLRDRTFPLLAPNSSFKDAKVEEAVNWVLGKEKLKLEDLRIEAAPKLLYFRHEERPLMVHPGKLVIGKPRPDEINRGFIKVNIAFTLPPGSYATLVVKRLFHFGVQKETPEDVAPREYVELPQVSRAKLDHKTGEPKPKHAARKAGLEGAQKAEKGAPVTPPLRERGFLQKQKDAKKLKASRRMENTKR